MLCNKNRKSFHDWSSVTQPPLHGHLEWSNSCKSHFKGAYRHLFCSAKSPIALCGSQNAIFGVIIETFLSTRHRAPYGAQCVGALRNAYLLRYLWKQIHRHLQSLLILATGWHSQVIVELKLFKECFAANVAKKVCNSGMNSSQMSV